MSNYCFITPEAQVLVESVGILQNIQEFSKSNKKQTYVLCKPLSKEDSSYDYNEACVIFISGMKPCFINTGGDNDGFDDYIEDFYDDVSFLSEKYQYRKKLAERKNGMSYSKNLIFMIWISNNYLLIIQQTKGLLI